MSHIFLTMRSISVKCKASAVEEEEDEEEEEEEESSIVIMKEIPNQRLQRKNSSSDK